MSESTNKKNQDVKDDNRSQSSARTKRGFGIMLVLTVALICLTVGIYAGSIINAINFESDDEGYTVSFVDIADEEGLIEGVEYVEMSEEELSAAVNAVTVDENSLYHQEGTTNILLLGIDSRQRGAYSRSDAIILLSVNRNTKKIAMTSLMRDLAVSIRGGSPDKLTHAHAYGGAPLVEETVESSFGIEIDQYVVIDFYVFIDVVDYFGGVEVDITENERNVMNNYVQEINHHLGLPQDDGKLHTSGKNILLTGKQALGYVRNRYSGGTADFGRTERQRIILTKVIEKLKASPSKAIGLLELVAPQVTTNYDKLELISEVLNLADYSQYQVEQYRVPADDTWYFCTINGRSMVACDFKANQRYMLQSIYGVTPEEVQ